jgi:hypothetical protein
VHGFSAKPRRPIKIRVYLWSRTLPEVEAITRHCTHFVYHLTRNARRLDWPSVDSARRTVSKFAGPIPRVIIANRWDFLRWLPGPQSGDFQIDSRTAPDARHGRRVHVGQRDGIGGDRD